MNKARKILLAGVGAMTPAMMVMDAAQARSGDTAAIGHGQSTSVTTRDQALKSALLDLSPTEKLRIAGDRIRLAKSLTKPRVQSTRKVPNYMPCHNTDLPGRPRQAPRAR